MYWRLEKGERWDDLKGAPAKRRMKALVAAGKAQGAIAFAGKEPVGWIAYGPRRDFPRLDRARTLACEDAERGLVAALLLHQGGLAGPGRRAAPSSRMRSRSLRRQGAKIAEGYPVNLKPGQRLPNAFAWTGTRSLFRGCGVRARGCGDDLESADAAQALKGRRLFSSARLPRPPRSVPRRTAHRAAARRPAARAPAGRSGRG